MKKIILLTLVVAMLLSFASCFDSTVTTSSTTKDTTTQKPIMTTIIPNPNTTTTGNGQGSNPNEDTIGNVEVLGVNEAINLSFTTNDEFTYKVYYKLKDADDFDYVQLDSELMIADGDTLNCYILGITAGTYMVKIEARGKISNAIFHIELTNINVSAQDRSGYAHFGAVNGVGAYNNDGTVKEGTKIIYVTNENKNTVTCEINGTVYTGLVNILQAQYKSSTPMLVRVIGKITTNQWNYKNVEPRLSDNSNATDDFFENTFSTEYGENLANLIVKMKGNGGGAKTYNYKTTPEGLTDVRETNGGTSTTNYKGSDFSSLKGKSVYDDDSYYNMLEVKGSKNITIEGVGPDAELFQFGIGFEESSSIEIKNLTFTGYPEDALNFLGGDREDLANHSRYWVHNCTFNRGYNAWDISGERDKYAGDGSIDFNNVSGLTLAYNYFNNPKKTSLFGSGDSEACMNMTMHHNYFYKVESRLPLGRNVNIHSYNNYFDQCGNCHDLRKGSYLFSENNHFYYSSKPFINSSSYIKSYGDKFEYSSNSGATIVTDRTKTLSGTCKPDKSNNVMNFDTNSELFYYDSVNKKSDVSIMLDAEDVYTFLLKHAGAGKFASLELEK
ncbi:MAG: hypothetical protein J6S23_04720 [Clostridia bacterium]|nr:hypothetical protein [Clostridia bacterium]